MLILNKLITQYITTICMSNIHTCVCYQNYSVIPQITTKK